MGSDHLPLIFNLNFPFSFESINTEIPRFNIAKANWNSYHYFLSKKSAFYTDKYLDSCTVDDLNQKISRDIIEAANFSIPKMFSRPGKRFPKFF